MFSFANGFSADVGGAVGTPLGGATRSGGRLALNGSTAYVQLDRPLVQYLDFTVALFAREAVTQPGYVEFISQGFSGAGGYLGRDPSGIIRMSDVWNNTGVAMPNDHLEHHYAVTYQAATGFTSLYVDGQLRATQYLPANFRFRGGNFTRFGRQFDPFGEFLNGELDDVTVHGRVLSAAEIQTLARRTPDLSCSAEGSLVSGGGASTFVTFENQSGEAIRVHWLDFSGGRVLYRVLPAGTAYTQQTYVTHPWIVTGATSGRCYGIWQPIASGRIVRIQ